MACGGDIGDADRDAIVEQVEDFADENAGVERDRFAGLDHHVAVGLGAHPFQEGDEVARLIIGAGDVVTAAEIDPLQRRDRSEEHTSELQSLMRISYAVFCLKKKNKNDATMTNQHTHSNHYKTKRGNTQRHY